MYGLRGSRAREKTALMPDPFRGVPLRFGVRKEFDYGTLDSRRMDMDMVRPRKTPGDSPQSAGLGKLGVA